MKDNYFKKVVRKLKLDSEISARKNMLDDLFDDIYRNRFRIYKTNFIRGIFFGLGTAIGGTLIVAVIIWFLNQAVDWFPYIGEYIKLAIEAMRAGR